MAILLAPTFCMSCGAVLKQSVNFKWGRLPDFYRTGEPVRWWRKIDGSIEPSFKILDGDGTRWNYGDPSCERLLVLDEDVTDSLGGVRCPRCRFIYEGIAIRISDGAVQSPTPLKSEFIASLRHGTVYPVKAFEMKADHSVIAREDWYQAGRLLRDPDQFEAAAPSPLLFDFAHTSIALETNGVAKVLYHGETIWEYQDYGVNGGVTRLVSQQELSKDWTNWEMHPAGEEIVVLLDGEVEVQVEGVGGDRASVLLDRQASYVRISRGVWHTMNVRQPSKVLLVTPLAETRQRARG